MTATKPLLLVDGSAYLYRAFHALPPLSTRAGQPTGAVFGVANMLRKLRDTFQPEYMAVVFDAPGKTFRDELFEQYKAHRPPMPDALRAQIEPLLALVKALGLPLLRIPGVEADDVIGTLARRAEAQGLPVLIASGDKDMAQLVNEHIHLYDGMKDVRYDPAGVEAKFGVPPALIIDYLALMGDTSDNIPGIDGVGPKTAAKWLQEYGSLDNLVAHADEIKGKIGEKLRAGLSILPLSRQLATIHCALDLKLSLEDLRPAAPDVAALRELYRQLEFRTWLRQLEEEAPAGDASTAAPPGSAGAPERDYRTILSRAELDAWLAKLGQAELIAFDTETTSLDYMRAEIVGVSFAVEPGRAAYVPLAHDYPGAPAQLERQAVLEALRPLLEDPERPKLGQHAKYDWHVLRHHGIELRGIAHDSMLESYVLNSTASRHDMDSLAEYYLGMRTIRYEDIAGKGAKQIGFSQVEIERATAYAAEDADVTLRLHRTLWPKLQEEPRLARLYQELEIPLIPVLGKMEHVGVRVDARLLKQHSQELAKRMLELERAAFDLVGHDFNLGSPKQLQQVLFDELRLPVLKKTPTGQPSTDEGTLEELALDFPLPKLILEHRSLSKLKSTYTDKLPEQINPRTGRVHTSYHQAVTSTGRLSSSDPNLQNIPVRTAEGRRIRQAFVAPPGHVIVAADYSQIELRIMAHLSGDAGLLRAFAEGVDIHRATAAEVLGLSPAEVSDEQRRAAKAINFGLIYGMSAFGLARQLGIPQGEAKRYVDLYFTRYPGVKAFMEATRAQAAEQGYVETLYGRRLYVPEIRDRNPTRRAAAERTAINAPMQGTAADIIKRAMLAVDRWLTESGLEQHARMIMQVHDELVFEVAESYAEAVKTGLREHMAGAARLAVPLVVDVGVGGNWEEAH
ncbi:MAG TPA: DNA polymerase I [Candidatus Competibacteraceae bacterium]|nr:DNA polymerase I [Candidatus Competibacteraceae bacterium]